MIISLHGKESCFDYWFYLSNLWIFNKKRHLETFGPLCIILYPLLVNQSSDCNSFDSLIQALVWNWQELKERMCKISLSMWWEMFNQFQCRGLKNMFITNYLIEWIVNLFKWKLLICMHNRNQCDYEAEP